MQALIQAKGAPDLGEQPGRPQRAAGLELRSVPVDQREARMALEAADDALDLILGKILGTPELGDLALPGFPFGIPIALDEPEIRTAL